MGLPLVPLTPQCSVLVSFLYIRSEKEGREGGRRFYYLIKTMPCGSQRKGLIHPSPYLVPAIPKGRPC